jgi:phosphatidate cytidylyltransferase
LFNRIFFGILLILISISAIYYGENYFYSFVFLFSFLALYEYFFNIIKKVETEKEIKLLSNVEKIVSLLFGIIILLSYKVKIVIDLKELLIIYIFVISIFQIFKNNIDNFLNSVSYSVFGLIYISLVSTYFLKLRLDFNEGFKILVLVLILNWSNDSFAFFIGTKFGKRKLCPLISPKKSVEGLYGGIFFTFVVGIVSKYTFIKDIFSLNQILILSLIVAIFCPLGDLMQSMIKRNVNIKDSSNLIPGHGGVLDRIDSLLFVIPLAYFFIKYYIN